MNYKHTEPISDTCSMELWTSTWPHEQKRPIRSTDLSTLHKCFLIFTCDNIKKSRVIQITLLLIYSLPDTLQS